MIAVSMIVNLRGRTSTAEVLGAFIIKVNEIVLILLDRGD